MATYNIIYDKNTNFTALHDALVDAGVTINQTFSNIGVMNVDADDTSFSSIAGVVSFEEDIAVLPDLQTDPYWHQLRLVSPQLPMRSVYYPESNGSGVDVYVVDTAIETTHSEFSGVTITNLWSHDDDFTPEAHGTAVASVIAGNTVGISSGVHIKSVVIPHSTSTPVSVLISAFDAILADHNDASPAVVNCSWRIAKSQVLDAKIVEIQNDNLVVVAAAGNSGDDANDYSPVGLDSVLGVGASDAFDRVVSWGTDLIMSYGEEVDITAPGIDITHAQLGGGLIESSGTSLAAGVVSGAVAQFIVANSDLNAAAIQELLVTNAKEDLLFRNETIYSTTPNKLIFSPSLSGVITSGCSFDISELGIKRGTSVTRVVEYLDVASSVVVGTTTDTNPQHGCPEWITLVDNVLTISPPADAAAGRYKLVMSALNSDNEIITRCPVLFFVYVDDPSELEDMSVEETYGFHVQDEVTVQLLIPCNPVTCNFSTWGTDSSYCAVKVQTCICANFGPNGTCDTFA